MLGVDPVERIFRLEQGLFNVGCIDRTVRVVKGERQRVLPSGLDQHDQVFRTKALLVLLAVQQSPAARAIKGKSPGPGDRSLDREVVDGRARGRPKTGIVSAGELDP